MSTSISYNTVHGTSSGRAEIAHDSRHAHTTIAAVLVLAALVLGGCKSLPAFNHDDDDVAAAVEQTVPEAHAMDFLLLSDLLRYHLDGDMEMDRGIADCYDGLCVQTDGKRIVISMPWMYVFAGHDDEYIPALEGTIENRNGILIGDVSAGDKPDIPGIAVDRTITGWGGWGEYVGFDALYYDYVRDDRPQRLVEASLGGYSSEGNPVGDALTWSGGAVGIDHSVVTENRNLVGDAELNLHFYAPLDTFLVFVDITDMTDVVTGRTYDDMFWRNIPLGDGGFETFEIRGRFFGPNHEEVGGIFERDSIVGGFAAKRVEEPEDSTE